MSIIRRGNNIFDPFSLDFDPFDGFPFGSSLSFPRSSSSLSGDTSSFAGARVDWKETPEAHVFKADLPGLSKEEIKVEVEDGRVLQISGERKREKEQKTDTWHRLERSSGTFLRRFRLPENAKPDQVKAAVDNGVLTVTVPKVHAKKAGVKSIEREMLPNHGVNKSMIFSFKISGYLPTKAARFLCFRSVCFLCLINIAVVVDLVD